MLKAVLKSLEEVPEALRSLYKQEGDKFVLQAEGLVTKEKLDEFRENNIQLKKQIDELSGKFKDIDPTKYQELLKAQQEQGDKKLIDEGKLDELLAQRTERMRQDFEAQTAALKKAAEEGNAKANGYYGQLSTLLIENELTKAAQVAGIRPSAMEDVILRGRNIFKLEGEKVVPFGQDGKPVYGKTGSEYLSIGEWVQSLSDKAPHLFEASKGGGAGGGKGGSGLTVSVRDQSALSGNLEKIASGEVRVTD